MGCSGSNEHDGEAVDLEAEEAEADFSTPEILHTGVEQRVLWRDTFEQHRMARPPEGRCKPGWICGRVPHDALLHCHCTSCS